MCALNVYVAYVLTIYVAEKNREGKTERGREKDKNRRKEEGREEGMTR